MHRILPCFAVLAVAVATPVIAHAEVPATSSTPADAPASSSPSKIYLEGDLGLLRTDGATLGHFQVGGGFALRYLDLGLTAAYVPLFGGGGGVSFTGVGVEIAAHTRLDAPFLVRLAFNPTIGSLRYEADEEGTKHATVFSANLGLQLLYNVGGESNPMHLGLGLRGSLLTDSDFESPLVLYGIDLVFRPNF